jgi:plastocyanin
MMRGRFLLAAMGVFGAQTLMAAQPAAVSVTIRNYHFTPQTLHIKAGTAVTWTNKDDDVHTVMATSVPFVSGALDTDGVYSYTFAKPGTYFIGCSLHPQMSATVVVE